MAIIKKEQIIKLVIEGSEGYRRTQLFPDKPGWCWKQELDIGTDISNVDCWGGYPPNYIVDKANNRKFVPIPNYEPHRIYFPPGVIKAKNFSARKPIDRVIDPETGTHKRDEKGLYVKQLDPHFKRAVAYFHLDNFTDIPDYWVVTDEETGEKFLYYPYPCEKLNDLISDPVMQRKLELIYRYHKLNVLFTTCKGIKIPKGPQETPKPYATFSGSLAIDKTLKRVDIEPGGYYPAGKIRTGDKNTLSKNIKLILNSVVREKFKQGGDYNKILNKKSIPTIILHDKYINEVQVMTNDKIVLQGFHYIGYGSDDTFIKKIFNKLTNKRYEEVVNNFVDLEGKPMIINLSRYSQQAIDRGEDVTIRFSVKNDYTKPRKEGATLTVTLAPEENPGLGKDNYFKGQIVKYDDSRNRLTLKLTDVVGNRSGDRWVVSYGDVGSYYIANQFNSKRNWSIDKGAQFIIDNEGGTKAKYKGLTPSYSISTGGYTKSNPSTTLRLFWSINGDRYGGEFIWKMTLLLKYGKRDNVNVSGKVDFNNYTLLPNSIFDDGRIEETEVVNLIPPDKAFDDLWVRGGSIGEEPITTEQFNQLNDTEKGKFRTYTIMDDLNVYNGLTKLLEKLIGKVNSIDPQEALKLVPVDQPTFGSNLQEALVNKILNEIKRQKF
jgi:hypothetical protein